MFDFRFALSFLPEMLAGLKITVIATLGGFAVALVVGLGLELMRRSRSKALRRIAGGWIAFIRCTPLLVQLYFVFYVAYGWAVIRQARTRLRR